MNRQPIGDVAFCFSWADEVLAHKIMNAFKPLEQEGLLRCFIPEYDANGESTIVNANTCIPLVSDMLLQDTLALEDAFSCYGCGQFILPILLDACDFKSIPAMGPQEVWVSRDKKEIKEMKYLPSDGIPLASHPDEDAAIRGIVDDFCRMMWSKSFYR